MTKALVPQRLKKLSPFHHKAMILRFQGLNYKEIAKNLEVKTQTIGQWFSDPLVKEKYDELVEEKLAKARDRLNELGSLAIKRLELWMKDPDPAVSLRALDIFNRMTGGYKLETTVRVKQEKVKTFLENLSDEELERKRKQLGSLMEVTQTNKITQKSNA